MSAQENPPPGRRSSDNGRAVRGCGSVLLILFGVILLLPGGCAILFIHFEGTGGQGDRELRSLLTFCFMVSAGGIVMIWAAVRWLRMSNGRRQDGP